MPDDGESSTGRQDSTQSLGSVNEVDVFNVTLEQLLDYLLATKRSLAATDHVWRANQLVHAAREAFVEVIELRARSIFVADGITSQLKILQDIKSGIEQVAWRGRTEFEVPTMTLLFVLKWNAHQLRSRLRSVTWTMSTHNSRR